MNVLQALTCEVVYELAQAGIERTPAEVLDVAENRATTPEGLIEPYLVIGALRHTMHALKRGRRLREAKAARAADQAAEDRADVEGPRNEDLRRRKG